jgi:hypothetical protein
MGSGGWGLGSGNQRTRPKANGRRCMLQGERPYCTTEPLSSQSLVPSPNRIRTPRLGRIRRKTHPSHMGHPSGSDGFSPGAGRFGEWHSNTVEEMPRLGRARRKTRPSLEWAFGWLLLGFQSQSRCGKHRSIRCESGAIQSAFNAISIPASRSVLLPPRKCPGSGAPRRKRAPKPRGDIRLASAWFQRCPRLGRARRKTRPSLWGHSVGLVRMTPVCCLLVSVLRERPGLGWARRKTHPSTAGHSCDSSKSRLLFRRAIRSRPFMLIRFHLAFSSSDLR